MNRFLKSIEKLFQRVVGFLGFDDWELYLDEIDGIHDLSGRKTGSIIGATLLKDDMGQFEAEFPLMIPDENNVFHAFEKDFVSPFVVVPFMKKKKRNESGDEGDEEQKNVTFYSHEGESVEREDGLDLSKVTVAHFYALYTVITLVRAVRMIESSVKNRKPIEEDKIRIFLESNMSAVYGKSRGGLFMVGNLEGDRFVMAQGNVVEPYKPLNELDRVYLKRRLIIPLENTKESIRLPNETHIGRVDLYETPESDRIGLSLVLVDDSVYDMENLSLKKIDRTVGHATSQIPFVLHSDGARIEMGSKNMKQALKVKGAEEPIVKTTYNDLSSGVNALVVYSLFYGFNFEDGIVVSESFAKRMEAEVLTTEKIQIEIPLIGEAIFEELKNGWKITHKWEASKRRKDQLNEIESVVFIRRGEFKRGETIGYASVSVNGKEIGREEIRTKIEHDFEILDIVSMDLFNRSKSYRKDVELESFVGRLDLELKIKIKKKFGIGDKMTGRHGNKGVVSLVLKDEDMPKVMINGEWHTADVVMSPLSVVSRMNISQLYETHVSTAVKFGLWDENSFDVFYKFDPQKREKLLEALKKLGADDLGRFEVKLKRYKSFGEGEKFIRAVAGWQYFLRLDHSAPDKFHAIGQIKPEVLKDMIDRRKKGKKVGDVSVEEIFKPHQIGVARVSFNFITLQPNKGKRRAGGQKMGEMEFWTLLDHGACKILDIFEKRNLEKFDVDVTLLDVLNYYISQLTTNDKFHIEIVDKATRKSRLSKGGYDGVVLKDWEVLEKLAWSVRKYAKSTKDVLGEVTKKDGFIRGYTISRRLYNSGRMVIVPKPDLKVDEVVLPQKLKKIWRIEKGDVVLINRQPSLHRHSIQAFKVKGFWKEYALGFPILACKGFNADFDGDTVAVYYLKDQKKFEDELSKMLTSSIPFLQGSGELAWSVDQDIVCGMNMNKSKAKDEIQKLAEEGKFDEIYERVKSAIVKATEDGLTLSIFEIEKDSGSFETIKNYKCRGSSKQWNQLNGKIDESIDENFLDGVSRETFEGYLAQRARRSLMDKKLHVAKAGYFTRKLVELAGHITIEEDGEPGRITYTKEEIIRLKDLGLLESALLGRFETGRGYIDKGFIKDLGKNPRGVEILSPIYGNVTRESLGLDPANGRSWISRHIGVIAGHTIGERGTQMSMQTFHTGGTGKPFDVSKIESLIFDKMKEAISEHGENPSEAFKRFIFSLTDVKDVEILEMLGKKDSVNLISDFFNSRFVYFEVIFGAFKNIAEKGMKRMEWYKSAEDRGILTTISFERGNMILLSELKDLENFKDYTETHPRAIYFYFGGDQL